MPLPAIIALAAKLLPFAAAVPDVIRAFGGEKAGDVADVMVDVAKKITGEVDGETAVTKIINDPRLQLEYQTMLSQEKITILKIEADAEKAASEAVTDRWKADMASDDKLSKQVRPAVLLWFMVLLTYITVASSVGTRFQTGVLDMILYLALAVFSAYFVGRTGEKGMETFSKMRLHRK